MPASSQITPETAALLMDITLHKGWPLYTSAGLYSWGHEMPSTAQTTEQKMTSHSYWGVLEQNLIQKLPPFRQQALDWKIAFLDMCSIWQVRVAPRVSDVREEQALSRPSPLLCAAPGRVSPVPSARAFHWPFLCTEGRHRRSLSVLTIGEKITMLDVSTTLLLWLESGTKKDPCLFNWKETIKLPVQIKMDLPPG